MLVAGVDGCRVGWVVVRAPLASGRSTVEIVPSIRAVVDEVVAGELLAAGVDMPMGLPESLARVSDTALRRHLGPRWPAVFPTPPRAVLGAADYTDAVERARRASGRALSRQAWHLVPKIAELDSAITPDLQHAIVEAHPESSFAELAGGPLVTRKATPEGRAERVTLLRPHFPDIDDLVASSRRFAVDIVDACAAAWTARRVATGAARWFGDGARDARGLRMVVAV